MLIFYRLCLTWRGRFFFGAQKMAALYNPVMVKSDLLIPGEWKHFPKRISLLEGEIYVFRFLVANASSVDFLKQYLTGDEHERAEKIQLENVRMQFVSAHAALNTLLARILNTKIANLEFVKNEQGKLLLKNDSLRFNLSHSQGVVLMAISKDRAVGVDVEKINEKKNFLPIAQRFFSKSEYEEILTLPKSQRANAFFSCWTRKEALVKAMGGSMARLLNQVEVSVLPEQEAPISIRTLWDESEAVRWSIRDLAVGYDCKAAVAAHGRDYRVLQFHHLLS